MFKGNLLKLEKQWRRYTPGYARLNDLAEIYALAAVLAVALAERVGL